MFLTAGCGHETPQNTDPVEFSVDKTSLSFTDEGGDQTFTVTTSETLYLVPGADWVKATKGESADNKTVVTVTVERNILLETRQTKLSVVAGDEKKYVDVSQEEAPEPGSP